MERTDGALIPTSEICEIIKTCSSNGVFRLRYRGLDLQFGPAGTGQLFVSKETEKKAEEVADRALAQSELEFKAAQLDLALIEDPAKYEEIVTKDTNDH